MGRARVVSTWQGVDTVGSADAGSMRGQELQPASSSKGWLAVVAIIVVLFGGLLLLVDGTARAPTTFDDVSQLTQAP